nr:DUF1697 domain-containing protein [Neobacillus sp. Marseille-Q6967]
MQIYIALLRGINVNGHNIIKMSELKTLFEDLGFKNVKTYIQSGNVLFEADQDAGTMAGQIEKGIEEKFGLEVPVVIRTRSDLELLIENCPYPADQLGEGETVHVAFLSDIPAPEAASRLEPYRSEMEDYTISGKDVYLFFRKSFHVSKLPVQLKKLGVHATVRNWRTVNKLADLAKEL